jgi:hypothetical protein
MARTAARLLTVLGGLALAAPLAAETRIGALGGANFAEFWVHPEEPGAAWSRQAYPGAGVTLEIGLGDSVSLRLDPMYLVKGTDFSFAPDDFLFEQGLVGSIKLSYIELPVMFRLSARGGSVRPYALLGPSVGYLTAAKVRSMGHEADVQDQFEKIDFGIGVGAGLLFPAGRASIFVEGRYTFGLLDISKDAMDATPTTVKNRGIQVMAGFTIGLGHGH